MLRDIDDKPIGFKFKLINEAARKAVNDSLREKGLTFSQMSILLYLTDTCSDGSVKLKDIEQYFNLKHPTVIGLVDRLAAKGMVVTWTDTEDRRCTRVALSVKQQDIKAILHDHHAYLDSIFEKGLSASEKEQLSHLLTKVYENFVSSEAI